MRVIGGLWRGRTIYPPKGSGTRPTTDRVRESLMSMLISARGDLAGACVLDAFAGSGALGIESLSRGAARATFCEKDRVALAALQRNLDVVGVNRLTVPYATVKRGDCLVHPPVDRLYPFDLVFLDPPYALSSDEVFSFLLALDSASSLADGAIISYEHSADLDISEQLSGCAALPLTRIQKKRYGETALDILRKEQP